MPKSPKLVWAAWQDLITKQEREKITLAGGVSHRQLHAKSAVSGFLCSSPDVLQHIRHPHRHPHQVIGYILNLGFPSVF